MFYRYDAVEYASLGRDGDYEPSKIPNPKIELSEFSLVKETPKGYWICYGKQGGTTIFKRWVSKTSKKRYAYPTKQEALQSFIKRNQRRIGILKWQLESCRISVSIALSMSV